MECSKEDWNLFRSKVPGWQEAYIERLNKEYIQILSSEGKASDKFWALEKRIYQDKRSPGVMVQLRKSDMPMQLLSMLRDGVIEWDDLNGFSPELQEVLSYLLGGKTERRVIHEISKTRSGFRCHGVHHPDGHCQPVL